MTSSGLLISQFANAVKGRNVFKEIDERISAIKRDEIHVSRFLGFVGFMRGIVVATFSQSNVRVAIEHAKKINNDVASVLSVALGDFEGNEKMNSTGSNGRWPKHNSYGGGRKAIGIHGCRVVFIQTGRF